MERSTTSNLSLNPRRRRGFVVGVAAMGVAVAGIAVPAVVAWTPTTPQVTVSVMGGNDNSEQDRDIAVDTVGNTYVVGLYATTADFDPGTGTTNLTSAGDTDAFIVKLDSSGDLVWARSVGGSGADEGRGIAVDVSGNVYVTGYYNGTADFDPGSGTANLTSAGPDAVFVLKLNSAGAYQWAHSFGSASAGSQGYDVAVDSSGNPHVTGGFRGTVDFDPSGANANLTASGSGGDAFVLKLSSAGAYLWAGQFGGSGQEYGNKIAVAGTGAIAFVGEFNGNNSDFDPGVGTSLLSSNGWDGFAVNLNASGTLGWAQKFGDSGTDRAYAVAVAGSDIVIGGSFQNTVVFDPGPTPTSRTAAGLNDGFVVKVDSSGVFQWVAPISGTNQEWVLSVAVDGSGNVLAAGPFWQTVDFDPASGATANLTSAGGSDAFVMKLDSSGAYQWAKQFGGFGTDYANGVATVMVGAVFVSGFFASTADFDPNSGTSNIVAQGGQDVFLAKLTPAGETAATTTSSTSTSSSSSSSTTAAPATTVAASVTTAAPVATTVATTVTTSAGQVTATPLSAPRQRVIRTLPTKDIVASDRVVAGAAVRIESDGFTPSETVGVGISGAASLLGSTTADADGAIAVKVGLPATLTGDVTVYAYGQTSKRGYKQVVSLDLPATGSNSASLWVTAFGLVLTGCLVVVLRRRLTDR